MTTQWPAAPSRYLPFSALSCWRVSGAVCPCSVPQHLSQAIPTRPPVRRGRSSLCASVGEPAKPRSLYYAEARKAR